MTAHAAMLGAVVGALVAAPVPLPLVATSVVIGQLFAEDTIVLMGIAIELTWPDHLDES